MGMKKMALACGMLFLVSAGAAAAAGGSLPKDYEKWEKSKDKVISDKSSLFYGIHNIYVDKKALPAYRKGGGYPEGSRFVVVNYNIVDQGGQPTRGKKNMVVLMEKNKKYKATGGWLFAGFTPEGKPSGLDPVKNCFECHQKEAADRDFVISRFSEFR